MSGGRRKCCVCDPPCSAPVANPAFLWVTFSNISEADCGCQSEGHYNWGPWAFEWKGGIPLADVPLFAEYSSSYIKKRFTGNTTYHRYRGDNWIQNSLVHSRYTEHGCRPEDVYVFSNGKKSIRYGSENAIRLEVDLTEDYEKIHMIHLYPKAIGWPIYFFRGAFEQVEGEDWGNYYEDRTMGSVVPNITYCAYDDGYQKGNGTERWGAFTEGGTAQVFPLHRPKTLSVTINSDGSNCSGCYVWPGGLYAQATGWTAPGTYTAAFISSDDDCRTHTYRVSAFNWGGVNLFTNSDCSSAASPSSETVNGHLDVVVQYRYNGWKIVSASGPYEILKFAGGTAAADARFSQDGQSAISASCGTSGDKIIRTGYTFMVEINEVI